MYLWESPTRRTKFMDLRNAEWFTKLSALPSHDHLCHYLLSEKYVINFSLWCESCCAEEAHSWLNASVGRKKKSVWKTRFCVHINLFGTPEEDNIRLDSQAALFFMVWRTSRGENRFKLFPNTNTKTNYKHAQFQAFQTLFFVFLLSNCRMLTQTRFHFTQTHFKTTESRTKGLFSH